MTTQVTYQGIEYTVNDGETVDDLLKKKGFAEAHKNNMLQVTSKLVVPTPRERQLIEREKEKSSVGTALLQGLSNDQGYQTAWLAQQRFPELVERGIDPVDYYFLDEDEDGNDVTIVSTGHLVWQSIIAAKKLSNEGIKADVINIHTIKPLDKQIILDSISKTNCIVSCEEHNIIGGLGESISRLIVKNILCPMEFVGVNDTFGESGKPEEIIEKMVIGRLRKFYEEVCLLDQTFVIDGETKISDVLANATKRLCPKAGKLCFLSDALSN